ncbi:MAG: ssuE [Rhizobacter sp.]|nr:ssuE [Rhizobacter sp.]
MKIVAISGSPSLKSRSGWLLQLAQTRLESIHAEVVSIAVRDLPAEPLLHANAAEPQIRTALDRVIAADVLLVSTPIYKAAYSGLLKVFLDLLPQDALRGKTVLPMATGGSAAHLLAMDYALKPVLSALGARDILDGVFACEAQLVPHDTRGYVPDDEVVERLDRSLGAIIERAQAESDASHYSVKRALARQA